MSAGWIALVVFVVVFGGACLGMYLRTVLPDEHLGPEARDAIKIAMAMIATLSALVLGLLTAAANSSLAQKQNDLRTSASQVVLLDRTLAEYGPETAEIRTLLKSVLEGRLRSIWPEEHPNTVAIGAIDGGTGIEAVQRQLLTLTPQTSAQHWLQSTALELTHSIAGARWSVVEEIGSGIQWPLLAIVVFWLAIIFVSFGLFAPHNASVTAAFLLAALSVAGSVFLILEMDQPYSGLIKIPSTALQTALGQLGKP